MDLNQQIQVLIDNAPQDGQTPRIIGAIAPALKLLAGQLQHSQYYILQSLDQNWLVTTLSNRAKPALEKQAIYAYGTLKDASTAGSGYLDPQLMAVPVPVTHILFQMMALQTVDSIVFFEHPGEMNKGTEVKREDFQKLIQAHLQQFLSAPVPRSGKIPPDIA